MGYLNPHTHDLDGNMPLVVTICGSTRFRAEMAAANRDLTLRGFIVLAPGVFQHDGDQISDEEKASLDALHLRKIDMSSLVYVVNPDGYMGESTRREVEYARQQGKTIRYLAEVNA
jgi:dienelactone hydrolase